MHFLWIAVIICAGSVAADTVTGPGLEAGSARLQQQAAAGASKASPLVQKIIGRGFASWDQQGQVTRLQFKKEKTMALLPSVMAILSAPEDKEEIFKGVLMPSMYFYDDSSTGYSLDNIVYNIKGDLGVGQTGFASFMIKVPAGQPDERVLYLFSLTTGFELLPDIVSLESCTSHSGFLGFGSHTDCVWTPHNIPKALDAYSMSVLNSYFTGVGLRMLGKDPDFQPSVAAVAVDSSSSSSGSVLDLLLSRKRTDEVAIEACKSSTCSPAVKQLIGGGFQKWASEMSVDSMSNLPPQGIDAYLSFLTKETGVSDPKFAFTLRGIRSSAEPVVYKALTCAPAGNGSSAGNCQYLLVAGNTTNNATDITTVKSDASFELAPHLVVVRETRRTGISNTTTTTTDKIVKVPSTLKKKDIDALLAFFELSVLQKLSSGGGGGIVLMVAAENDAHCSADSDCNPPHGFCDKGSCACSDGMLPSTGCQCKIDCGLHGVCHSEKCFCHDGYTGADCSVVPNPIHPINVPTPAPKPGTSPTPAAKAPTPAAKVPTPAPKAPSATPTPAGAAAPKPPAVPGKSPTPVPAWEQMLQNAAKSPGAATGIMQDIAAGQAMTGGSAIGGFVGGLIGFIPQIASIFHTSSSHSDQIVGEITNKGYKHFQEVGDVDYEPGIALVGKWPNGTAAKPFADIALKGLLDAHYNDIPVQADRDSIKLYIQMMADGWTGNGKSGKVVVSHKTMYNQPDGTLKIASMLINVDHSKNAGTYLFWHASAAFTLAPRLIIHRVSTSTSNIFSSKSNTEDVIHELPPVMSPDDLTALMNYFNILAVNEFAAALNICKSVNITCGFDGTGIKP